MPAMSGKICLVTGATRGIGRVTAQELARMGATVIIVGHNTERGKTAASEIRGASGSPNVEFMLADLSSQASIRQLAETFRAKYPRLDVLVNNAGALFMRRQLSADGIEMTFALNHLGYFLLTNLLLESLKAAPSARIVNVSSDLHYFGRLNVENLQGKGFYNGFAAYFNSKLANVSFTYELARRLAGTSVTANALHPGFVASSFGYNNGLLWKVLFALSRLITVSPERGAQTSLYLAASPEVEGVTGGYFHNGKAFRSAKAAYDQEACLRLWQVSEQLTGLATP